MSNSDITMATETIHNPAEPRHFLRFKPMSQQVRIRRQGKTLAESANAMRMTEVGRDVYDPIVYVPQADISPELVPVPDKTTHCPLKGDAHYLSLADGKPIAWTYDEPLEFATVLRGYVAFYPSEVSIEETGAHADN